MPSIITGFLTQIRWLNKSLEKSELENVLFTKASKFRTNFGSTNRETIPKYGYLLQWSIAIEA